MHNPPYRALGCLGLLLTLAGAATLAHAQQPAPGYAATPLPVAPQPVMPAQPLADGNDPWRNVVPEQGVVVSGTGAAYGAPPPVIYAPPVYVRPAYAWPQAYVYPPIGISLGIGYSRGWHGGGWHRGWR